MRRKGSMSPQAFAAHLRTQARQARARRACVQADAARLLERQRLEATENATRWAALEARLQGPAQGAAPDPAADRSVRLALPSGPRRLVNLPERDRGRYRDHLNRIIAAAMSDATPAPEPAGGVPAPEPAAGTALLGRLCACCGGGCCTRGGHTAYLSAATIRRYMAGHPGMRPREVLAAYLDRLAFRTEAGSCVNHTAGGCGLPREMRSDICNRYLCAPLSDLRGRLEAAAPPEVAVVVVRRQDQWRKDRPGRPNEIVGEALVTATAATPPLPWRRR
jgi:hypothetical protein